MSDAVQARSTRRRIAPYIALALLAVLGGLVWVLASSDTGRADTKGESFLLGKPAPTVVTTDINGKPFDLGRRRGSWVVLNFFNSTCVPCKAEHADLVKFVDLQRQLGSSGAELYTVINDDDDASVKKWFAANGGDWPILHDTNGAISVAFGVAQVPETWIIDPNGIVQVRFPGPITADQLAGQVEKLRETVTL